jgi:hypothetical protein
MTQPKSKTTSAKDPFFLPDMASLWCQDASPSVTQEVHLANYAIPLKARFGMEQTKTL